MPASFVPTFDLARFVTAQQPVIDAVRAELAAGRKTSHWMWFVFPQLRGLGRSTMAERYALASLAEAAAYAADPLLGERLVECTRLVLRHRGRALTAILGTPDNLKFVSCMTLFEAACPGEPVFGAALAAFNDGRRDPATLRLLPPPPSGRAG